MAMAELMADIRRFPRAPTERDERGRLYVPVTFAALSVVVSVAAAVLTGGIMLGRFESDLAATMAAVQAQQQTVNGLVASVAATNSRVDALGQALGDERNERIELERRLNGGPR